jgi:hypothetical protein
MEKWLTAPSMSRRTVLKALGAGGVALTVPGLGLLPEEAFAIGQSPAYSAGSMVGVVSRSTDKLDIFATDVFGNTDSGAWEPDFTDGWHGWWDVQGGVAVAGAPITPVSRSTDKIDIFVVGTDQRVYTAGWTPSSGWQGWNPIPGITVPQGSFIGAVSRDTDLLDIFATGTDGNIYTAGWSPSSNGWQGWRRWAAAPT